MAAASTPTLPLTFQALGNEDLTASLQVVHKPIPPIPPHHLLVRISHASLNSMDAWLQRHNTFHLPLPLVLGFDFAGTVVAVGGDGQPIDGDVGVGAEVLGGAAAGGAFSQYLVVPRDHLVPRRGMPSSKGSTLGVAFSTAHEGLHMELGIRAARGPERSSSRAQRGAAVTLRCS